MMSINLISNLVSSLSTVVAIPPPVGALESLDHAIRDDLQSWRTLFFGWLLITTGIVAIGVIMEAPEIWYEVGTAILGLRGRETEHRHAPPLVTLSAAIGWLLIVLGVVGELFTDGLVSWADTKLQNFDEIVLEDTLRTAGTARESATDAADAAGNARASSAGAVALAQGARQEADSFAHEIASAKNEAADAVSRLAGADQKLADATERELKAEEELKRLKTPRSLSNIEKLVASLRPFKGTEYTMSVAQDDEAFQLTRDIDKVLNSAGWTRKQPQGHNIGITYFNIFSQDFKDGVPVCVATGVAITVRSKDSLESLQSRPFQSLPKMLQTALALQNGLVASILPSDNRNVDKGNLDPKPGEEGPMQICVGRKP